jgi:hypothetical protein
MRNISFALTQEQVRARIKTVTRRAGWANLQPGTRLRGVNKCQGLKPGEKPVSLAVIEVVDVRREALDVLERNPAYGRAECILEGFPGMEGAEFVAMFCDHMMHRPEWPVTRIEFRYLDGIDASLVLPVPEQRALNERINAARRAQKETAC